MWPCIVQSRGVVEGFWLNLHSRTPLAPLQTRKKSAWDPAIRGAPEVLGILPIQPITVYGRPETGSQHVITPVSAPLYMARASLHMTSMAARPGLLDPEPAATFESHHTGEDPRHTGNCINQEAVIMLLALGMFILLCIGRHMLEYSASRDGQGSSNKPCDEIRKANADTSDTIKSVS